MRTISTDDLSKDWRKVATEAQHTPVCVQGEGAPDLVILSQSDYDQIRGLLGQKLKEHLDKMGAYATAQGLTEEKLEELLADES
jgi:PHD/YefM family antitoxin component YafN of YafNO toxin-antitoxin module